MGNKVFVGLSGGVDSAVSAKLLIDEGYDVTGVFMKNWSGHDLGISDDCPWEEDLEEAKRVAEFLGIKLKIYNFEKEYREAVIEDFFEQYSIGNTPNPDILCNTFIKFDAFLERCRERGADMIATGHYVQIVDGKLAKGADPGKDQSYFLSRIPKEALRKTLFPIGHLKKSEVRELARKYELPNAERKDSQGICFVGHIDLKEFLSQRLKPAPGDIVDYDSNEVVGEHQGVWFHTIGQRKGLKIGGSPTPYFVSGKSVEDNKLYVVQGKEHPALWSDSIRVEGFHPLTDIGFENLTEVSNLHVSIRYRSKPVKVVSIQESTVSVDERLWAVAKGQYAVFYDGEVCLGSAIIR